MCEREGHSEKEGSNYNVIKNTVDMGILPAFKDYEDEDEEENLELVCNSPLREQLSDEGMH